MITIDQEELGKIKLILTHVGVISKEAMIEQSSKAGNKTRLAVRRRMLQSNTDWIQVYQERKRGRLKGTKQRTLIKREGLGKTLGTRVAHRKGGGIDNPWNMMNFVTSFTMETTGTTVVGGVHKGFNPPKIRDGKIVGRMGRVNGVSKQTIAILEKLNSGAGGDYENYLRWDGKKDSMFDKSKWKKRHFFEKGWRDVKGQVVEDMTAQLKRLIGERANNIDLKEKKYAI